MDRPLTFLFIIFLGINTRGYSQIQTSTERNWGDLADSTATAIDSLIKTGELYTLQINEIQQHGYQKSRKYFIDTSAQLVYKVIVDTIFSDHISPRFAQVLMYFYKGERFRICYLIEKDKSIDYCTTYNAFTSREKFLSIAGVQPYSQEMPILDIFQPPGLLPKNWLPDLIDKRMRLFVEEEIRSWKFIQGRRWSDF